MSTVVIMNPYANRWTVKRLQPAIERELHAAGVEYELHLSERPGHATDLARRAAEEGAALVIAVGGDGTVHEVVGGLCAADGATPSLGIVPCGSGNDLAAMLGVPENVKAACARLARGQLRTIDIGEVHWEGEGGAGSRYFDNNAGLGLEPEVTIENTRITGMTGTLRYLTAALRCIARSRPWSAELEWHDGHYKGPVTLLSVGNTPRNGGMFYLNPYAKPDDGVFDFIYGSVSRPRLLQLLPMSLRGWHINEPEIISGRTPWIKAHFDPPTPVQCDGEVVATGAHTVEFRILPKRLQVVV